jgi:methylated-DNA-protein-cysteine methyltransferase-like protein
MTILASKVYQVVREIPKGKVATYGWVAAKLGKPKAAQAVGNALHQNPDPQNIPCHRVVDRTGRLAPAYIFGGPKEQKRKLMSEGVKFKDKTHVDLTKSLITNF